ncbi:MAG: ACT domain-containing protein [Myxococcales bacterium]|nr:MAG: ACT domain-containing protein [Myxococcales bacterium]
MTDTTNDDKPVLELSILPMRLAIAKRKPDATIPAWALGSPFFSITRTDEELSVVCEEEKIPKDQNPDKGWRCLKVHGPMPLDAVGILASLSTVLAAAEISVFAIASYDTDYILVKAEKLEQAIQALDGSGFVIHTHDDEAPDEA